MGWCPFAAAKHDDTGEERKDGSPSMGNDDRGPSVHCEYRLVDGAPIMKYEYNQHFSKAIRSRKGAAGCSRASPNVMRHAVVFPGSRSKGALPARIEARLSQDGLLRRLLGQ